MAPRKDWRDADGALLRLRLARPKANIVDAEMIAALHGALVAHGTNPLLRGVLLDHEGPQFSFGASVEEPLPAQCAQMLASLHALISASTSRSPRTCCTQAARSAQPKPSARDSCTRWPTTPRPRH